MSKVLKVHGDVSPRTMCSEPGHDVPVQADFLILTDESSDWRAVCEDCSYGYDWEEAAVLTGENANVSRNHPTQ